MRRQRHFDRLIFLGLWNGDHITDGQVDHYRKNGFGVWALNDYYDHFPWLKPDAVFQCHKHCKAILDANTGPRFRGGYAGLVDQYNQAGHTMSWRRLPEVKRNSLFNIDKFKRKFGECFLSSGVSYMFAHALLSKRPPSMIALRCVRLMESEEYINQLHGMLMGIDAARKMGVEVSAPFEDEWRTNLFARARACKTPYGGEGLGTGTKDACHNPHSPQNLPANAIPIVANRPDCEIINLTRSDILTLATRAT